MLRLGGLQTLHVLTEPSQQPRWGRWKQIGLVMPRAGFLHVPGGEAQVLYTFVANRTVLRQGNHFEEELRQRYGASTP